MQREGIPILPLHTRKLNLAQQLNETVGAIRDNANAFEGLYLDKTMQPLAQISPVSAKRCSAQDDMEVQ